jgi:hypothetical protein
MGGDRRGRVRSRHSTKKRAARRVVEAYVGLRWRFVIEREGTRLRLLALRPSVCVTAARNTSGRHPILPFDLHSLLMNPRVSRRKFSAFMAWTRGTFEEIAHTGNSQQGLQFMIQFAIHKEGCHPQRELHRRGKSSTNTKRLDRTLDHLIVSYWRRYHDRFLSFVVCFGGCRVHSDDVVWGLSSDSRLFITRFSCSRLTPDGTVGIVPLEYSPLVTICD